MFNDDMIIFALIAGAVVVYALYTYSERKRQTFSGMSNYSGNDAANHNVPNPMEGQREQPGLPVAARPLGQNISPGLVGNGAESHPQQKKTDPTNLLPNDSNDLFSKMNPEGRGDVQSVSLLKATHHLGINTVGSSLRNANLQLRSEPANPQQNVGPWNNATIGPDLERRPLEIGSS